MKRYLTGDLFCLFCDVMVESTSHLFFECRRFVHVWKAQPFNLVLPKTATNFRAWFRLLREKLDGEKFILACVMIWGIWWRLN